MGENENPRYNKWAVIGGAVCTVALVLGMLLMPDTAQAPSGEEQQAQQVRT